MTEPQYELPDDEVTLRLAKLELRVDLLAKAVATALDHCPEAKAAGPTTPRRINGKRGAL